MSTVQGKTKKDIFNIWAEKVYSQIPFEAPAFKTDDSDYAVPFSAMSCKELINHFNTKAGIDTLIKSVCRVMFLLLQELVNRGIDFDFFKPYDKEQDLHLIMISDRIEL